MTFKLTTGMVVLLLTACRSAWTTMEDDAYVSDCARVDKLSQERYELKSGNYYANKIIPVLEKRTGIDATCQKGTYGYLYANDSIFNSDIQKWRNYLNCTK